VQAAGGAQVSHCRPLEVLDIDEGEQELRLAGLLRLDCLECSVHRNLQAHIRLLDRVLHRHGIWNALRTQRVQVLGQPIFRAVGLVGIGGLAQVLLEPRPTGLGAATGNAGNLMSLPDDTLAMVLTAIDQPQAAACMLATCQRVRAALRVPVPVCAMGPSAPMVVQVQAVSAALCLRGVEPYPGQRRFHRPGLEIFEERSPPPTVFRVWVAAVSAARRSRLGVRY